MSEPEPSEDVRRFLSEHVATYEELEVLLHLVRHADSSWSVRSLARQLDLPVENCESALITLHEHGLLHKDDSGFRFDPAEDWLATQARELESTYRRQRFTVVEMMSKNAVERMRSAALRTFAQAFRMRGPKK